jgi:hypothetical protein
MSKVIDVRSDGGELVILGKAIVLPSSTTDGADLPLDGSVRFNPDSGAAQVYTGGSWAPLGDTGGAHTHTIAQVTGLVDALAGKSSTIHVHPFNEVPGLQAALDTKSPVGHQHSIANVINLQEGIDALQTSINDLGTSKANTTHTQAISTVTGLQGILDGKANTVHVHTPSAITGLSEQLTLAAQISTNFYVYGMPEDEEEYVHIATQVVHYPANFAGSFVSTSIRPSAPVTINIIHEHLLVGSVVIDAVQGVGTLSTISTQGVIVSPGEKLTFKFPVVHDPELRNVAFALIGVRP